MHSILRALFLITASIFWMHQAFSEEACTLHGLPLQISNDGTISIFVEQYDLPFMIDTGSNGSFIRASLHSDLSVGLKTENQNVTTFSGSVDLPQSKPINLNLNSCGRFLVSPIIVPDLSSNIPTVKYIQDNLRGYSGLLGRDFLMAYQIEINYNNAKIDLEQRSLQEILSQPSNTPARLQAPYLLDITYDEHHFSCVLDTGFVTARGMYIFSGSDMHKFFSARSIKSRKAGLSASRSNLVTQIVADDVHLGGLHAEQMLILLEDYEAKTAQDNSLTEQVGGDCIIGGQLLRNTALKIDSGSHKVEVYGNFPIPSYNRTGFSSFNIISQTEFEITTLEEGSPAHNAGIRIGDVLIVPSAVHIKSLLDQPKGSVVTVTVRRNDEICDYTFTLRDTL